VTKHACFCSATMFTSKERKKFIENHSKFSECANSCNKCFFAICSNSIFINLATCNKSIFTYHEEAYDLTWASLLNLTSEMFSTLRLMDGLRLCGAPGWNLERGPFYIIKPVVNREKIKSTNWSVCMIETKQAQAKTRIVN